MNFEPRGKVAVLMDAMRASPEKIVWPADEVAMVMEVARGNLPAYLQAVVTRKLLHRKIDGGKSFFSLQPFPEGATAHSIPGTGLEQKLIPSPTYTATEIQEKQQDVRAPKSDQNCSPPKMICARRQSEPARAPLPEPLPAAATPERIKTRAPAPEESTVIEQEALEEEQEFDASLWLNGDLDLFGLVELDNGAFRVPAEKVAQLRKLLAWMPC